MKKKEFKSRLIEINDQEIMWHIILPLREDSLGKYNDKQMKEVGDSIYENMSRMLDTYYLVIEYNKINKPHAHVACLMDSGIDETVIKNYVNRMKRGVREDLLMEGYIEQINPVKLGEDIFIKCTKEVNSPKEGKLTINDNRHLNNLELYLKRKEGKSSTLYYRESC